MATPAPRQRPPLQVLAIKRNDTGEWALPGGMVKPGDSVSATVKKSFSEVGKFKDPAKQEKFDELVKVLFAKGVDVFAGYVDDPRNTDNAWMESKVMHFHCSPELGELLPLNIKKAGSRDKDDKMGQVSWIDCSKSQEPRYAKMVRRYSHHSTRAPRSMAVATRSTTSAPSSPAPRSVLVNVARVPTAAPRVALSRSTAATWLGWRALSGR